MYSEPCWSQATSKSGFLEIIKDGKIIGTIAIPCGTKYFTFGRLPENNVPLDHESISRKHAVLQFGPRDTAFIYDLGSSHGTFVNKKQITSGQYVKVLSGNGMIRFGASSRHYILNLEENSNVEISTNSPRTNEGFRASILSFFSENGISLKTIESFKVGNLFSCTLDFSECISIDSSEPSRITSSGASEKEAFDNFYEDSYNFLSRSGLIDRVKNDLNSGSDSDISNEDFYNYDHSTSNDSKPSNMPLTESEILTLRNSFKSKMEITQAEIAELQVALDALEKEIADDFDVFVLDLKKDELKKDIKKRENILENIKKDFLKYENILVAIGHVETPEDPAKKSNIIKEVESGPINSLSHIKPSPDDANIYSKTASKRIKITDKTLTDIEIGDNDTIEEQFDFEDSTLHDEKIDLTEIKRKYGY